VQIGSQTLVIHACPLLCLVLFLCVVLSAAPQFDQTATIGILVHSAIDGLALGAISVSDNSSLELVVFFAIILHKAPAAFGLTSFLLHQGRERSEGQRKNNNKLKLGLGMQGRTS
jgi:hypothetical protein